MARWQVAVVTAVLFLCILLATAPARLLGYMLPSQQLLLQGYRGSLWHGSADSAALAVSGGYLQLGRLQWDVSPWSLVLMSARAELEARWGGQTLVADVSISPNGNLRLRGASVNFPARLVRQWLPVQLRGTFNLLTEDLSFQDLWPDAGSGRLVWQGARWIGNTSRQKLGDYVLEFEVREARQLEGVISTLSGPIRVQGKVTLSQQQYSVNLDLSSEKGISAELGSALQLIAEPTNSGYRIQLDGTL